MLAVMAAGMIAVPVSPDMELNRLARILNIASPCLVLTMSSWAAKLRSNQEILYKCSEQPSELVSDVIPKDLAAIFFTSGSTGEPKGVMLTNRNLTSNAASIVEYLELNSTERAGVVLPFQHALGNSIWTSNLLAGGSIRIGLSVMFPEDLLDTLERDQLTSISGVPEVFHRLLNHSSLCRRSFNELRFMSVAGGMLQPQVVRAMNQAIAPARFFVMYGQTEATARLAFLPPKYLDQKIGSIGLAIPGVKLQVVGDDGQPVATGMVGELRASGPNISPGYWNDPQASARVFRDGWLCTGDNGKCDEDGFIYLTGRQSDLLKRYGFRIHPRELDDFLSQRLRLEQSVTVTFPREGEPGLAVFAKPSPESSYSDEDLRRLCKAYLPRYKQPDYIEIVANYPLNDALKIDMQALSRRAAKCA